MVKAPKHRIPVKVKSQKSNFVLKMPKIKQVQGKLSPQKQCKKHVKRYYDEDDW